MPLIHKDAKEVEDRFYLDLEFGTGDFRGLMGAGTNRINKYMVGKALFGLGNYLLAVYGETAKSRGVVISYDIHKNSAFLALITANVLSSMGIRFYLHMHARSVNQWFLKFQK